MEIVFAVNTEPPDDNFRLCIPSVPVTSSIARQVLMLQVLRHTLLANCDKKWVPCYSSICAEHASPPPPNEQKNIPQFTVLVSLLPCLPSGMSGSRREGANYKACVSNLVMELRWEEASRRRLRRSKVKCEENREDMPIYPTSCLSTTTL